MDRNGRAGDCPPQPQPVTALSDAASDEGPYAPLAHAPASRPFVVAQLGQSLDGRIATLSGESRWINKDAALDHVHRLRALVDAVVVGVGTVVADDPLLNVRRVQGRHPARVVIDPSGRTPADARCLATEDGTRRIVVTTPDAEVRCRKTTEVVRLHRGAQGALDPNHIVATLAEMGLHRLLIEGGASTVSQFMDAGALDRLHVLVAPVILGSGKTGLGLQPIARLADARRPCTKVYVLADGDVLFDCDMRRDQVRQGA